MPALVCTAKTCIYNKNELCSKGDIKVEGKIARTKDETWCCSSFQESGRIYEQQLRGRQRMHKYLRELFSLVRIKYNEEMQCHAAASYQRKQSLLLRGYLLQHILLPLTSKRDRQEQPVPFAFPEPEKYCALLAHIRRTSAESSRKAALHGKNPDSRELPPPSLPERRKRSARCRIPEQRRARASADPGNSRVHTRFRPPGRAENSYHPPEGLSRRQACIHR